MTELRRLNKDGVDQFEAFITDARNKQTMTPPVDLLTNPAYSEAVEGGAALKVTRLTSKLNAAEVLADLLEHSGPDIQQRFDPARSDNEGLWSWLSLYFFDSLCPPNASGQRNVRAASSHLPAARA